MTDVAKGHKYQFNSVGLISSMASTGLPRLACLGYVRVCRITMGTNRRGPLAKVAGGHPSLALLLVSSLGVSLW